MNKRKFAKTSLKLIILLTLFFISVINLKTTLFESLNETNQLTFIKDVPEEKYILKKFAYISGAVIKPGVYELKDSGTRIQDVIEMAGGLTSEADTNYVSKNLNLASIVTDSDHIAIPTKNVTKVSSTTSNDSTKININDASAEELDSLPGVGPATALKIINARPFSSIEDIKNVSGIGDSKFSQIKDLITI